MSCRLICVEVKRKPVLAQHRTSNLSTPASLDSSRNPSFTYSSSIESEATIADVQSPFSTTLKSMLPDVDLFLHDFVVDVQLKDNKWFSMKKDAVMNPSFLVNHLPVNKDGEFRLVLSFKYSEAASTSAQTPTTPYQLIMQSTKTFSNPPKGIEGTARFNYFNRVRRHARYIRTLESAITDL